MEYMVWEYRGFGMHRPRTLRSFLATGTPVLRALAEANLGFGNGMARLVREERRTLDDGYVVVVPLTADDR
jgi:hypothetical protein